MANGYLYTFENFYVVFIYKVQGRTHRLYDLFVNISL